MRTSQSTRVVVALAAAGLVAGAATSASAKKAPPSPPPSCNLLVDAIGDVSPQYSGTVDIVSADIASGQATVVGVLRVEGPVGGTDAVTATGARWDLAFSVNGTRYTYELRSNVLGAYMATFSRAGTVVAIPAVRVDTGSITWTVPRAAVTDLPATPNGDPIGKLTATTFSGIADLAADSALSKATYQDGYPSCVKAA